MPIIPPGAPTPESNEAVSDETFNFDYPGSDIVLRSCDSHNFRVPKLYVINSSPVLQELIRSFSNASDVLNGEEPEPLPVVKLPESGATLHSLLTFIFPVTPILPSTAEKIMKLLAVAQKYQMDSALNQIRGAIARQDPPFIRPETALHIYFLAQEHELQQEAAQAARVTFRLSMTIEDLGDKLDFPGMTGAYLHELWKYHKRVRTVLKSDLLEFRNSGLPDGLRCEILIVSSWSEDGLERVTHLFPQWLDSYFKSIVDAPHLFDLIEFENAWTRHILPDPGASPYAYSAGKCLCVRISSQVIRTFWEALTTVVYGTIEKERRLMLLDFI
jgi:hypothetical protein